MFCDTILLMSEEVWDMMRDVNGTKERIKMFILSHPNQFVWLWSCDWTCNPQDSEIFKEFKYFRFMMKKVKSHKFTKIINKADMIFFISKGVNGDCKLEHDILLSLMTQRTVSREGWSKRQCHRWEDSLMAERMSFCVGDGRCSGKGKDHAYMDLTAAPSSWPGP
jgi:hypothetical protein